MNKKEKEKVFLYLDILRESGATNMYGAGVYLERDFDFSKKEAQEYLLEWMKTFEERHTN